MITPGLGATIIRSPPPLRNRNRDNFVPLRVFGFPVSLEKLDEWAKAHGIGEDERQDIRQQIAWKTILNRRPEGWMTLHTIYDNQNKPSRCIILATNQSAANLAGASNVDLIQKYQELLGTDEQPGWYRVYN